MPPAPRKVRLVDATQRFLQRVGIMPTSEKAIRLKMTTRLGLGPGRRMAGAVPTVPSRDLDLVTRDGTAIRLRVYEPEGATGLVLYSHGGGFVLGGLRICDHICRKIAAESQAVVVSTQYRLAPEHPFPVPLDDCEDALDWVLTQPWAHDRLVIAGDSAGGNLTAALALRAQARGLALAGQVLIYPAVDLTMTSDAIASYDGIGLTPADCHLAARTYLAGADPRDPYASPLFAPDLAGLPPALVVTVEHDPLRAEGALYAERLLESGVPTTYLDMPGHAHGSLSSPTFYDDVVDVHAAIASFVRSARVETDAPSETT